MTAVELHIKSLCALLCQPSMYRCGSACGSPTCEDDVEGWNGKCNHLTRLSDADADFDVVHKRTSHIVEHHRNRPMNAIPNHQRHHLMGFALRVHWDGKVCHVLFAYPHIRLCAIYQELKLTRKWIGICMFMRRSLNNGSPSLTVLLLKRRSESSMEILNGI